MTRWSGTAKRWGHIGRWACLALATATALTTALPAAEGDKADPDAGLLAKQGVQANDANSVTAYLRRLYDENTNDQTVAKLISQLGADDYNQRQEATNKLLSMPNVPEAAMKAAAASDDLEVKSRAEYILKRIRGSSADATLLAALRTICQKQHKGAGEAILKLAAIYPSPYLQTVMQEALRATARPEDLPALRQAAKSDKTNLRIAATVGLVGVGEKGLADLKPLMGDRQATVALAAARATAELGDRESLLVLGKMLSAADPEVRARSIVLLRALTSQKIEYNPHDANDARQKAAEAWMAWISTEGKTAKLRLPLNLSVPELGRTLICMPGQAVIEMDADGKEVFKVEDKQAWAGQGLPNGHRLIGNFGDRTVVEYDANGNVIWKRENLPGGPMSVQRLASGNTLMACSDAEKVIEIKPDGTVAWEVQAQGRPAYAQRLDDGHTLIACHRANRIIEVDADGKEVWALEGIPDPQTVQRLANGNTVVAQTTNGSVREYNRDGDCIWSHEGFSLVTDAQRLSNGNTLVVEQMGKISEVSPDGKVVWTFGKQGQSFSRVCRY